MTESLNIQIARVQEQLKTVFNSLMEDRQTREETRKQLNRLIGAFETLDRRIERLEEQLAKNNPTIEEFVTIKEQIKGAGWAGRWVWAGGATLIGLAYSFREAIHKIFAN